MKKIPLIYRFEILYQTKNLKKVNDFLEKCDLQITHLCFKDIITFIYTKEEKPISYFKELIAQAMTENEYTLVHIVGGKIE